MESTASGCARGGCASAGMSGVGDDCNPPLSSDRLPEAREGPIRRSCSRRSRLRPQGVRLFWG
eukprot:13200182-Alexandrium_andersonii.AAC.1